jgi:hypothetical protein
LGDKWIMLEFAKLGYDLPTLVRLNQVRLYQQVVFLSCVLGASGKELDEKYLYKRPSNQKWSTLGFPNESPPRVRTFVFGNKLSASWCQRVEFRIG